MCPSSMVKIARYVLQAYEFPSLNYRAGDDIYLLGFVRGAYTARRVVGMMRKAGLLPSIVDGTAREVDLVDRSER